MTSFHYHSSRTRERDPIYSSSDESYYPSTSRTLIRRPSSKRRNTLYTDDDLYDDYPYNHSSTPSRALTLRRPSQPSQLEKYNVWSDSYRPSTSSSSRYHRYDTPDDDITYRYKYTTSRSHSPPPLPSLRRSYDDDGDREYKIKVNASFSRPKSSHGYGGGLTSVWGGGHVLSSSYKRREKYEDEGWEEKSRKKEMYGGWFGGDVKDEKTVRYRKVKRTRTDEFKPLRGWKRAF